VVNFYAGASIVAHGDGPHLYDRNTQGPILQALSGLHPSEYFLHPPFFAVALTPLALLPLSKAYVVWLALNAGLIAVLGWLFTEAIPMVRSHRILGMLGFGFFPILNALTLGQDSILLLALLTGSYILQQRDRPVCSGLVLSLLAIKFQYFVILSALLFLSGKRRMMLGALIGSSVLLAISIAVVGPQGMVKYFALLHAVSANADGSLRPYLMINWRGFLAGLGSASTPAFVIGEILLLLLGCACARSRGDDRLKFAAMIAVAIIAAPYAHFADAAMLLLPMLFSLDRSDRLLLASASLFMAPIVLLALGGHYVWNSRIYLIFPVILLFLLATASRLFLVRLVPVRATS
jgi:hypothetical protein